MRRARRPAAAVVITVGSVLALLCTGGCRGPSGLAEGAPSATTAPAASSIGETTRETSVPALSAPVVDVTTSVASPVATISVIPPAGVARPGPPPRTHADSRTVSSPCTEATGHVDALTFESNVLAIDQPQQHYLVYTPPCYRADAAIAYPVVYLLHGAQVDEHQWEQVGLFTAADQLIAAGTIAPMVLVSPDAIWAMGSYDGDPPLLDRLLFGELLPAVEADYRVRTDRGGRAIGGISRGGEWALLLAGRHPDQFAAVGGHSPAVGAPSTPNPVLVPLLSSGPRPAIRLDVGSADGLVGAVQSLDQALQAAGIAHEIHIDPGTHDRSYWQAHVSEYLEFYGQALR